VPNTFEQQARERLGRSLAFMDKSQALLQDDLLYRSALADAVSAIKNMLQGYLLLRIAATPASSVTEQWQEVANTNSMPSLIGACIEAGLDLRGLAGEVKRLNAERNYRTHEDPQRLVDAGQAEHALKVARDVQRRIKDAVQGRSVARSLPAAAVERARAVTGQIRGTAPAIAGGVRTPEEVFGDTAAFAHRAEPLPRTAPGVAAGKPSGTLGVSATSNTEAAVRRNGSGRSSAVAVGEAAGAPPAADDTADVGDDSGELAALAPPKPKRRGRSGRIAVRLLATALLLGLGVAMGVGAVVFSTGHAPGWLGFAAPLLPTAPTATGAARQAPTRTPSAPSGPVTLGALRIAAPACAAGTASFTLTNTGGQPLSVAAGSPDAGTLLATAIGAVGQPAIFATLRPGASATLSVLGGRVARVNVTAPAGSVQLLAPSC